MEMLESAMNAFHQNVTVLMPLRCGGINLGEMQLIVHHQRYNLRDKVRHLAKASLMINSLSKVGVMQDQQSCKKSNPISTTTH